MLIRVVAAKSNPGKISVFDDPLLCGRKEIAYRKNHKTLSLLFPMLNITWSVKAANVGQDDEHIECVALDFLSMRVINAPLYYEEANNFIAAQERLRVRFDSYELPCDCSREPCRWHSILVREWQEEDADAIDSWLETRDDFDALIRRIERKVKKETENDPDVY